MTINEIISNTANIALMLSVLVALIFGIAQVRLAARDRKERLTLEALRFFQSREFVELIYTTSSRELPATMEDWMAQEGEDQIKLLQFSQAMEHLGMLVAERYINLDLVDKTLGVFVITSWEKFKPVIKDIREKQPDPFLNEYFQWLAEHLNQKMEKNPRRPFFERSHW